MPSVLERLLKSDLVLCDGALGTMFYARGIFINRCYDELNLTEPELVRGLHDEYLQAGAEVIETNTFGASAPRLERYGLSGKVAEINRAGAALARQAVAMLRERHAGDALVAGSVGPLGLPADEMRTDLAFAAYAEQIAALVEGGPGVGVDLLMVETVTRIAEAEQAVLAAKAAATQVPVIVMMTVDEKGVCLDGTSIEDAVRRLEAVGVAAIGCNCSSGPDSILSTIEKMRGLTALPLAAMPNAGMPSCVDGRNMYLTSPEYMASFARKAVRAGATIVGGCCGTTPTHIKSMRSAIRALSAQKTGAAEVLASEGKPKRRGQGEIEPPPLEERSRLGGMIARGEFVTMMEIVPPRGFDCTRELDGAAKLSKLGIHAINVPDSPRASSRMSAMSLCLQIEQKVGTETVLHFTCRDRNILGIQGDLLGARSMGLRNILCLTGDPPKLGDYPDATAVFDVDAIGLAAIANGLNHGLDLGGNSIGQSTGFTLAVAANPGVADIDAEVRRFERKVEAGGEYAITQPVFDLRLLEQFLRRIEGFKIPVIAGIWPLTSVKNAQFMKNDLKVRMPDEILARMGAVETPEHARAEGIKIAQEMLMEAQGMVQGVQVSAPFSRYEMAAAILESLLVQVAPRVYRDWSEGWPRLKSI